MAPHPLKETWSNKDVKLPGWAWANLKTYEDNLIKKEKSVYIVKINKLSSQIVNLEKQLQSKKCAKGGYTKKIFDLKNANVKLEDQNNKLTKSNQKLTKKLGQCEGKLASFLRISNLIDTLNSNLTRAIKDIEYKIKYKYA